MGACVFTTSLWSPEKQVWTVSDMTSQNQEILATNVDLMTSKILCHWDWRASGDPQQAALTYTPSSPNSSPYSSRSSPEPQAEDCVPSFIIFPYNSSHGRAVATSDQQKQNKPKLSSKRRMKASEREKLRMRSLAEALHQLRDYLPPVYSRQGQPLTKIQTLKYTIEYIKELSDILSQKHGS